MHGAVATITLPSPALTAALKSELVEACTRAADDSAVRAIVLTGTGRSFCVGQDLAEHAAALQHDASTAFATIDAHYNPIVLALTGAAKPVVAAINGTCVGAGLALALACDIRVAAAGTKFATAFTAIGLTFDSGLSATLARAVGGARASELMLLGEQFTAEDALAWGLVGRVVPRDELETTTAAIATRLADGPTLAYAATKDALAAAWAPPLSAALAAEAITQSRLGRSADHREAVEAFVAKRTPRFVGSAAEPGP